VNFLSEGRMKKKYLLRCLRVSLNSVALFGMPSDQAKSLISGLLTKAPVRRLSAQQALEHPWIKNNIKSVSTKSLADLFNHFNNFKINGLLQSAILMYIVKNCKKTEEFLDISREQATCKTATILGI
jgi:serine/threonine protein kinase